ncbi:MAG: 50S ribosomal protein L15 [Patescibacteria group bacterium]
MQKNTLKPTSSKIRSRQIGRGGKRGKTSGRGHKGQKARAGRKIRPEVRDFIKSLPKLRGHSQDAVKRKKYWIVNVSALEERFSDGDDVHPDSLFDKGLIEKKIKPSSKKGVKVLGHGELSKKLVVSGCELSSSAKEKIEKTGGKVKS